MIDLTAIDDSIGYMTEMRSICSVPDGNVAKVYDTALAALRECAERREGCEYCTAEPNERVELIFSRIGRTLWEDYETAGQVDGTALFCPMCGRKLERGDT